MRIANQRDFLAGAMFLAVGAGFAVAAAAYPFGDSAEPGPGYFPFGLGILLAALGLFEMAKAARLQGEDDGQLGRSPLKPLATIVVAVVVFGFTLPALGLFLALPLLVVMTAFAGQEFRWHEAVTVATLLTAGSWLIFVKGLQLTLPLWPS